MRLQEIRLRLADASADLRPLPSADDIAERAQAVASQLEEIVHDLRLVIHVSQMEARGLRAQVAEIDRRLAEGWIPEGSPVEDVVVRLQAALES